MIGRIGGIVASAQTIETARRTWAERRVAYAWRPASPADFRRESGGTEPPEGPAFRKPLGFWPGAWLWHFGPTDDLSSAERPRRAPRAVTFTAGTLDPPWVAEPGLPPSHHFAFDGRSGVIHGINRRVPSLRLQPQDGSLQEYLAFFCEHVHGASGPFTLIETGTAPVAEPLLVPAAEDVRPGHVLQRFMDEQTQGLHPSRHLPSGHAPAITVGHPVIVLARVALGQLDPARQEMCEVWPCIATVVYAGSVFRSLFAVQDDGMVHMLEDGPVSAILRIRVAGWAGAGEEVR
jgi:hypothetical protein